MASRPQTTLQCLLSLRSAPGQPPIPTLRVQLPAGVAMRSELLLHLSGGGGPPLVSIRSYQPEPITFACDLPLPAPLAELLAQAGRDERAALSGTVTLVTADRRATMDIEFDDALLAAVALSPMNAQSREAGHLLLTLQPTAMRLRPRNNEAVTLPAAVPHRRRWLVSNFKLDIAGLLTRQVAAVGSVAMHIKVDALSAAGEPQPTLVQRFPARADSVLLTTAFSERAGWLDWEAQTSQAPSGPAAIKPSALLTLLGPDLASVLGTVELHRIGIERFELAHPNAATGPALAVKLFASAIKWSL